MGIQCPLCLRLIFSAFSLTTHSMQPPPLLLLLATADPIHCPLRRKEMSPRDKPEERGGVHDIQAAFRNDHTGEILPVCEAGREGRAQI
uniref:Putative secreted protein n=1 Tax=Amblyomma cajennense TaxID=34607 RepID=A0A023FBS0_AMBCJ